MSKKKKKIAPNISEAVRAAETAGQVAATLISPASRTAGNRLKNLASYLKAHALIVGIIGLLAFGVLGSALKYLDEDAQREIARRANSKGNLNNKDEQSFLNKVNPFLPAALPDPTPQLSKEFIYAGGQRLVAVVDAAANEAPPSDLAIWRPSSGDWWVMGGTGTVQVTQAWGVSGDDPVEGDYDGDGKTDFAVFRPSTNYWYLIYSSTGGTASFAFGSSGDQSVPADYDGDGKTDIAVFRNSNTTWYISQSSTSTTVSGAFGASGDIPAPADFDGDGRADPAVFRESNATFYSLNSSDLQTRTTSFGAEDDIPVPADYDGDGYADIAMWRSSNATWYILQSSNNQTATVQFGIGSDKPVQNDYDGDGKVDIAVWRTTGGDAGKWYIRNSTNPGNPRVESWGAAGDIPVPAFWKR